MPSEFPNHDPRNIWQTQTLEPFKMSADQIRRKAQQYQTKDRFAAIFSIAIGIVLCVFFARTFIGIHDVVPRAGLGVLTLWCIYFAYQAYKWVWPSRLTADATVGASLQFYRSELERRRDYAQHVWRRAGLTFCFLGLAMIVVPPLIESLKTPRTLLNAVPFFVLLAIW